MYFEISNNDIILTEDGINALERLGMSFDSFKENINSIHGEVVPINVLEKWSGFGEEDRPDYTPTINTKGRWPANLLLDEEAGRMLDEQSGLNKSNKAEIERPLKRQDNLVYGKGLGTISPNNTYDDFGGASRFFYCTKVSPKERGDCTHPTMKPISLLEYLVRLVTPKNGIVLDPFSGSCSTGIACKNLGFSFIGIELNEEYYNMGIERLKE